MLRISERYFGDFSIGMPESITKHIHTGQVHTGISSVVWIKYLMISYSTEFCGRSEKVAKRTVCS